MEKTNLLLLVAVLFVVSIVAGAFVLNPQKPEAQKGVLKGTVITYNFTSRVDLNMNGTLMPSSIRETTMVLKEAEDRKKLSFYLSGTNTSLVDSYILPDGNFTCSSFPITQCVEDPNPPSPPTEIGSYLRELEGKGHIVLKGTSKETVSGFECDEKIYEVEDVDAYLDYLHFNKSEAIPIDVDIDKVNMTYCEKDGISVYYTSTLNAVVNKTSAREYLASVGTNESETSIPDSIISNVSYILVSIEKSVEIPKEELTPPTP